MIVVDAGPLVAAAYRDDQHHRRCLDLFAEIHAQHRQMIVPEMVVTEVCYLLEKKAGSKVEADFLRSLADSTFIKVGADHDQLVRMAELVERYADLPLGAADASVVSLAERLGVTEVATLDLRHFSVVRPRHVEALSLLPR